MDIIQGANYPQSLGFEKDMSKIKDITILLYNRNYKLKQWRLSDIIINGKTIDLPMSQEDTINFKEGNARLEIKWTDADGVIHPTEIIPVKIRKREDKTLLLNNLVVNGKYKTEMVKEIGPVSVRSGFSPYIGEDGYWYQYQNGEFIKTNFPATGDDGITPHIDPITKHWFIGETDTGIIAEGSSGTFTKENIDSNTLKIENGILKVYTTDNAEEDNTKPITSSGVYVIVGNIDTLLSQI